MFAKKFPNRSRGQIIVMFPAALIVLLLLATLTLDGAMMQQSQRDLEIIATHAARAGAVQIDRSIDPVTKAPIFDEKCNAFIIAHTYTDSAGITHTPTAEDCNFLLVLDPGAAANAATTSAQSWLAQVVAQQINLPGFAPIGLSPYVVSLGAGNKTITVTVHWCYQPMFLKDLFNSATCPRAVLVSGTYTAEALAGQ